jgi:dihydrolipoamide dehydrogenase
MQLAHYATSQGLTVAENACKLTLQRFETVVPSVIFTIPEAASVGLTETMAKAEGRDVQIAKFRFGGLGRAVAAAETMGFVKLITDPGTDQLLGAAVVGPHATELIAELTVAVRAEITAKELASTIHAHPTFSEAWMEAAHAVHGLCVHAPPRKR